MFENHKVVEIDPIKKEITFDNNTIASYESLISTMPLPALLSCLKVDDPILRVDLDEFVYSSAFIVGLGIVGELPEYATGLCWMYFPEKDIPFYRATWLSNYSECTVPEGHWSLLLEVNE